jgi:D-amino-acid oxidase
MDELDPAPDPAVARAIVQRCAEIPEVAGAEVLGQRAGFRPGRRSIRVERVDLGDRQLIHNYGQGGAGVSVSWGCAEDVRALMP